MGSPVPSSRGKTISPMAPYRDLIYADFRLLGFPFYFADGEQATLLEPKTGLAEGIVTWVTIIPLLGWVFTLAFPMVSGHQFAGHYMKAAGIEGIDTFGSLLMIVPYYTEGVLTLYLYKAIPTRLTAFLRLFNEKLGSLISPGIL